MRVQRLVMPSSGVQSWTLLGGDHVPVAPVERFLAYLASIDRSPNTIRAYAHDLKDWFVFLSGRGVDWRSARLEDVGAFAGWLRLPPAGRDGRVAVLPSAPGYCGGATVNRKLAALASFCEFHAVHGESLAGRWGDGEPETCCPGFVLRVPRRARGVVGGTAGDECATRAAPGFDVDVQAVSASHH